MAVSDNKLVELTERLSGRWRVTGAGIDGEAEYKSLRGGLLLVMNVDFVVNGTEMKVIQHVTYDQDSDELQAHYMDTMGDQSTYTWVLDGQNLRVSLVAKSQTRSSRPPSTMTIRSTSAPGTIPTMLPPAQPTSGLYIDELKNKGKRNALAAASAVSG